MTAEIESFASSLRIVLVADAVPSVAPVLGLDKVTVKASLASTVVLPATLTVIVLAGLAGREADRPGRQNPADEVRCGDGGTADRPVGAVGHGRVAGAADGKGERRAGRLTLGLARGDCRDRKLRVVVDDRAGGRRRPQRRSRARVRQGDGEGLAGLDRRVAGNVDGDRAGWSGPAAKLTVPDGRTPPAKSAAVTAAPLTTQLALWATDVVARAGDRKGERRAARLTLGLARIGRGYRKRSRRR